MELGELELPLAMSFVQPLLDDFQWYIPSVSSNFFTGNCGSSWILAAWVKGHPDLQLSNCIPSTGRYSALHGERTRFPSIQWCVLYFAISAFLEFKRVSAWQPRFHFRFPIYHYDVINHRTNFLPYLPYIRISRKIDIQDGYPIA